MAQLPLDSSGLAEAKGQAQHKRSSQRDPQKVRRYLETAKIAYAVTVLTNF